MVREVTGRVSICRRNCWKYIQFVTCYVFVHVAPAVGSAAATADPCQYTTIVPPSCISFAIHVLGSSLFLREQINAPPYAILSRNTADEKRRMPSTKSAACSRRKPPHAADEKRRMPPTKSATCRRRKAPHAADEKRRMPPTKSTACRRRKAPHAAASVYKPHRK